MIQFEAFLTSVMLRTWPCDFSGWVAAVSTAGCLADFAALTTRPDSWQSLQTLPGVQGGLGSDPPYIIHLCCPFPEDNKTLYLICSEKYLCLTVITFERLNRILDGIFLRPSLVVYFSAFPGSPQKLYSGKTKTKTNNT